MASNEITGAAAQEALRGRGPGPQRPRAVGFLFAALGHHSRQRIMEALRPLGLGPRDMALLRLISDAQGLSQRALGRVLGIPPSRMVALIDDFEERGLVERRVHASDRRVRAVFPTRSGQSLLRRAEKVALAHEQAICAGLDAAEREQLLTLLERVAAEQGLPGAVHPALAERTAHQGASVSTNQQGEGR